MKPCGHPEKFLSPIFFFDLFFGQPRPARLPCMAAAWFASPHSALSAAKGGKSVRDTSRPAPSADQIDRDARASDIETTPPRSFRVRRARSIEGFVASQEAFSDCV
jgi:hypothetical protein